MRLRPLFAFSSCLLFIAVPITALDFSDHILRPRVSLPSLNSTNSFWLHLSPEESPLADVGSTGSLTQDADVCVIGSGITGVGVAWHLVKDFQESLEESAKMKIVLLEARQFCKGILNYMKAYLNPFIQVQELLVFTQRLSDVST